jgi:HEPN domain-containing protein/predicted nucleotidyltransferase
LPIALCPKTGYNRVMLVTIDDVRDRLIALMDPESIILFGSRARGEHSESSDADILIIQETTQRPIERRMAAERILADRALPLDIFVYTPDEMRRLYALGSPFVEEIVETGRVLYMRKATEVWLTEADEELATARILTEHGKLRGACLHSQQCVEKCLKASVLEKGDKPERTHDLVALRSHAERLGWKVGLDTEDAVFLNSVYKGRYPSEEGLLPHGEPTTEEAARAVSVAERVFAEARAALRAGSEG